MHPSARQRSNAGCAPARRTLRDMRTPAVKSETLLRLQHIPPGGCVERSKRRTIERALATIRLCIPAPSPQCSVNSALHQI